MQQEIDHPQMIRNNQSACAPTTSRNDMKQVLRKFNEMFAFLSSQLLPAPDNATHHTVSIMIFNVHKAIVAGTRFIFSRSLTVLLYSINAKHLLSFFWPHLYSPDNRAAWLTAKSNCVAVAGKLRSLPSLKNASATRCP